MEHEDAPPSICPHYRRETSGGRAYELTILEVRGQSLFWIDAVNGHRIDAPITSPSLQDALKTLPLLLGSIST